MENFISCLFFGLFCAIAAYGIGTADAANAIFECEKNLPRNQHCEIYAKPKPPMKSAE